MSCQNEQNSYNTESTLQIRCNPHQKASDTVHRNRGGKITWKHKMPYIVKTTLSKKILIFLSHGNKKKKKKHGTELRKDL